MNFVTDGSKQRFTFTWKIENFDMLPHEKGEPLESPSFTVDLLAKTKYFVRLFPRGDSRNESDQYMSCFLCRKDFKFSPATIHIDFTLAIESASFREILITCKNKDMGIGWGTLNLCSRRSLLDQGQYFLPKGVLTIKCNMWPSENIIVAPITINDKLTDEYNALRKLCSAITRIKVQRRNFTWSIPKIDQLQKSRKRASIVTESVLEGTPSLNLSFCFSDDLTNQYSQFEISQTRAPQNGEQSQFVKCKITVLSANKEYQDSHEASHLFSSAAVEVWHFPEFLKMNNLVENKYVADNSLLLHFEFAFSCKGAEYHFDVPNYAPCTFLLTPYTESSYMSDSIHSLYASGKFCDVTLLVGEKRFPCHKVALCALSPVFCAMFETDMQEKNSGLIEIKDLDPKVVERMLVFMHSNVVENTLSTEDILKLYEAADKYQVLRLKWKCSLLLLSTLSVRSVCDVLAFADRYQDNLLLVNVHNFLSIHTSEIFLSPQWKVFTDEFKELSDKVMRQLLIKKPFW